MSQISFNKNIYHIEKIKQAIAEYKSFADFELKEDGDHIEIKLENIDPDHNDIIIDEFANYVLGLMA